MKTLARLALAAFVSAFLGTGAAFAKTEIVVVIGAAGEAEYGGQFAEWAQCWQQAGKAAGAEVAVIGPDGNEREKIEQRLAGEPKSGGDPLWLVLIGHGTFDGEEAKFNLQNADLTAHDLKTWLAPCTRPLAVIDLSAASAPFIKELSGPRRVIITAARSGSERDFARFGGYFSKALNSSAADLGKDGATSLLEAFVFASRQVTEFYESEKRIVTEHALLDDNADSQGTPASAFSRTDLLAGGRDPLADGALARAWTLGTNAKLLSPEKQKQRDRLESEIAALRQRKKELTETDYYRRLELSLLNLARLDQLNASKP